MAITQVIFISWRLLLAGVCWCWLVGMPCAAAGDRYGDALPEGAIARLGTAHLRGLCDSICFSADGKTLIGVDGGCLVRIWDAGSGKLLQTRRLADRPYRNRWQIRTARSANGKTLLIGEGASLQLWDLPSGKRLDARFPTGLKRLDRLVVSNDHRFLLLLDTVKERLVNDGIGGGIGRLEIQQNLLLWDTTTGKSRRLAEDERMIVTVAISPDGKRLASSSYGKGTCIWDVATGKLIGREAKFNAEKVEFTTDSRYLIAAPGGGQSVWHVWDAATGRPSKEHKPPIGYTWTFAVSLDGHKILIPTDTDYVLWDMQAGKVLQRWPGAEQAGKVAFAPDGCSVVTCDAILRRWDVATGNPLYADVSRLGHTAAVRQLFFTPDGKRLASVADDETVRIWDVTTSKPLHRIALGADSMGAWTLTPDGGLLLGVDENWNVHRWSMTDGRPWDHLRLTEDQRGNPRSRTHGRNLRIARDGETLVLSASLGNPGHPLGPRSFSFWNMKTGRLRRWGADPGGNYRDDTSTLSPDGRFAVSSGGVFDTRTGQQRFPLARGGANDFAAVFSPDGRLLATIGGTSVRGWELATGRLLFELPKTTTYRASFAPNGRRFAFIDSSRLIVHDLRTGKVLRKCPMPEELFRDGWPSSGIAFAPDGRTIATGHGDGTILLWDASSETHMVPLTEREPATLWDDLANGDPIKGYAAIWRFRDDPTQATRYLRKRLPPIAPPPEAEVRRLIRRLDSDHFTERESASRQLEARGRSVEAIMRQALKDKPTLEQKRRLNALLNALPSPSIRLRPDDLRAVRAVAILEGINTAAARQVLMAWAKGLPSATLTEEAEQALARLKWRPAVVP